MTNTEQQAVQDAADAYDRTCMEVQRRVRIKKEAQIACELADDECSIAMRQRDEAKERLMFVASHGRANP